MKLRFKLGQKGFTLVELMVVVAILSVLMAIVAPAVTGTKEVSISGQVKSDADATQKAVDNYSNKSIKVNFPTASPASTGPKYTPVQYGATWTDTGNGNNVILLDKDGKFLGQLSSKVCPSGKLTTVDDNYDTYAREFADFTKTTSVYDATGAVKEARFVPDFLIKLPASLPLAGYATKDLGSSANVYPEYLWLAKVNAPGTDQASRAVEVYRLQGDAFSGVNVNVKAVETILVTPDGLTFTNPTTLSAGQSIVVAATAVTGAAKDNAVTFMTTKPLTATPATGLLVYQQIF